MRLSLYVILFIFSLTLAFAIPPLLQEGVGAAYRAEAPPWIKEGISWVYPRFEAERHRLPLEFFVQKATQLVRRLSFIIALVAVAGYFFPRIEKSSAWQAFLGVPVEVALLGWVRKIFLVGLLLLTADWGMMLAELAQADIFYQPILIFRLLHIPFPPLWGIWFVFIAYIVALVLGILYIRPSFFTGFGAVLFLYMNGLLQSFEKFDHGFATAQYVLMLLPLVIWQEEKAHTKGAEFASGWALQLARVAVAVAYFMSGLEKLWVSGLAWLGSEGFSGHLMQAGTPLGQWLMQYSWLLPTFAAVVLLWQLSFITVLFNSRLLLLFLTTGWLFHWSTSWLLGVGGYLSPWLLAYTVFIQWHKIIKKMPPK